MMLLWGSIKSNQTNSNPKSNQLKQIQINSNQLNPNKLKSTQINSNKPKSNRSELSKDFHYILLSAWTKSTPDEVDRCRCTVLEVVVWELAAVLQLNTIQEKVLFRWWDTLQPLDPGLELVDCSGFISVECDLLASQGLDDDAEIRVLVPKFMRFILEDGHFKGWGWI